MSYIMSCTTAEPAARLWLIAGFALLVGCMSVYESETRGVLPSTTDGLSTDSSTGTSDASTADASTSGSGIMTTTVGSTTSGASDSADTTGLSDTATTEASTGEPIEPGCGNGILEPGEDCDDGNDNPDDGCFNCAFDRVIFVTSEIYQGHKLEGLVGADARCRMLAALAGLPQQFSFKAWLSTAEDSAASRMLHRQGRYVLTDGTVIAYGWDELTSGTLRAPINRDEHGMFNPITYAWTGTLANGEPALDSDFCNNWNAEVGFLHNASEGQTVEHDDRWSFSGYSPCASESSLYCVQN